MRGRDAPFTDPRNRQTLLLHGDRNAARRLALKACIDKGRMGERTLYLQQRILAVNESALRSMVGSENVMLGIFESLGEVAPMISEIKPSIAVIDPVNGINEGYLSRRRLALDLFEMATAAARLQVSLILLCDMTEWNGISTPRHYSMIRRFCDCELEVKNEQKTISREEAEVVPGSLRKKGHEEKRVIERHITPAIRTHCFYWT